MHDYLQVRHTKAAESAVEKSWRSLAKGARSQAEGAALFLTFASCFRHRYGQWGFTYLEGQCDSYDIGVTVTVTVTATEAADSGCTVTGPSHDHSRSFSDPGGPGPAARLRGPGRAA